MGMLFVFLIGFLYFHIVTGQNCNNFKLFDGDREVTSFTCKLNSTSCDDPSSFPNLFDGDSVEKPRNFEAREFRRNFTYKGHVLSCSGMTFTWKPPISTSSRKRTKGYYMKRLQVGSGKRRCTVIDLQQVNLSASTDFHFSYELFPIYKPEFTSYLAYLMSLPPPSDSEFEIGLKEQVIYTVQPGLNYSVTPVQYPNKWTTWINLKLHKTKGVVEVTFGYPTPESLAQFTQFDVQIVPNGQSNPLHEQRITKNGAATEGKCNFTNIPSGLYKVQLMPHDTAFNQDDCQCWQNHSTFFIKECSTCRFSTTEYFNFTSDITTTFTTSTTTSPQEVSTPSPEVSTSLSPGITDAETTTLKFGTPTVNGGDGVSAGVVAAAVVISLVVLIAALVLLLCLHRKGVLPKLCSEGGWDINGNFKKKSNPDWKPPVNILDITRVDKDLKMPNVQQKKILLLASEDHQYFTQAVERMAAFLQLHCQCEVTFAPQQMPQLRKANNTYCWLSRQIDSADFIIIVTSEAAHNLFLAYRKGNSYGQAAWGPEGDLFTPGIQHICGKIASNGDTRNVVMVYFPHTSPNYRLPIAPLPSFHYRLPLHLPNFLHHIHGLDKTKMDLSKVNLPLLGNVEELEGGREWLDAVQKAEKYEQQHPRWFEQKFGSPAELYPSPTKPAFTNQISHDSGFNDSGRNSREMKRQRRLSSASLGVPGGVGEDGDLGVDNGVDNSSFSNKFFPPSVCMTVYTVPYPGVDKPSEIDEQSITEQLHHLNRRYEQEQLQESGQKDGPLFNGLPYDPQAAQDFYPPSLVMEGFDSLAHQDVEDHDCISVLSAQSV